jgi:hypothetical protein
MKIDVSPNIEAYFEQIVHEAVHARQVDATAAAEHYLAGILSDYARGVRPEAALDRPVTFELHEALATEGAERFERLRTIGDAVLYVLGFFGACITRRGADGGYLMSLGASAYGHASSMLRLSGTAHAVDVLDELSEGFDRFVIVVREVADSVLAVPNDDTRVLKLYERWERSGSARLAEILGSVGICPVKAPGGVH